MSEQDVKGEAIIKLRLIVNDRIRAYQLQIKGYGNYDNKNLETWIDESRNTGRDFVPLYMGAVLDVEYWRSVVNQIMRLERRGYRAVGRGAKIFPEMVLDEFSNELEKLR